jgi:hypothetical protein
MTDALKATIERLETITGLECIFPDSSHKDGEDFIDDMTAHIIKDGFDFCIDIPRETEAELKKARKRLEKALAE